MAKAIDGFFTGTTAGNADGFPWSSLAPAAADVFHGQLGLAHTRGPPPIDLQWITGLLLLQSPFGFEPVDPTGFIRLIGNVDDLIRIAGHVE